MKETADRQPVPGNLQRLRVEIHGAVQGVGFRPFVYRLATELALTGWVINDTQGVFIEVEGPDDDPAALPRTPARRGSAARHRPVRSSSAWLEPVGYRALRDPPQRQHRRQDRARPARHRHLPRLPGRGARSGRPPLPLPLHQLHQLRPALQHHRGAALRPAQHDHAPVHHVPGLPAPSTRTRSTGASMRSRTPARSAGRGWRCTDDGRRDDVDDGSQQALAIDAAARAGARPSALRCAGRIVAVKGLGGFHLMADAGNDAAIGRLRERKPRRDKPFAIMAPRSGPGAGALLSPARSRGAADLAEAPIVLLERRQRRTNRVS